DAVSTRLDARVAGRRVVVVGQRNVVGGTSPDRQRVRVERHHVALVERGAREYDELAELERARLRDETRGRGLLRLDDDRLLREAKVARGRADDPPDEEVEQD